MSETKKIVEEAEVNPPRTMVDVTKESTADLLAMRSFLYEQREHGFVGKMTRDIRGMIAARVMAVENEIFMRVYGFNPLDGAQSTIVGITPEKALAAAVKAIDLESGEEREGEDVETFKVFKNQAEE